MKKSLTLKARIKDLIQKVVPQRRCLAVHRTALALGTQGVDAQPQSSCAECFCCECQRAATYASVIIPCVIAQTDLQNTYAWCTSMIGMIQFLQLITGLLS
jgi:hypothetical protein